MASSELALRMKYRKFDEKKLQEIFNDEKSSETEKKVAAEFLEKLGVSSEKGVSKETPKKKTVAKKTPSKKVESDNKEIETEDGSPEAAMARQNKQIDDSQFEEKLTLEEEARLSKAEAEYDERQKNRKTPSKSDKGMKSVKKEKSERVPRETKRQNLEESTEIEGLKVGSKVCLKGQDEIGEVTRIYKSGDGKEKCMVKFSDGKPIKKRVTAVELK